jgi:alpha-tubulin suppressor-like RCC1 family protein
MAITADRSLWLWGDNSLNQLGDLFTGYRTEPWRSPALAELTVGASAWTATCAIRTGGTVWCWGRNNYGQIGDGTTMARSYPVQVRGIQDEVVEISVGVGSDRVCARKLDGSVWCWGFGYGPTPKRLVELGDSVAQVSSGGMGVCVRKTDGTLWCWGANVQGFVGDGTTIWRDQPVQVTALGDAVAQVAAGDTHVCARKTDGSVWCWGSNLSGELGNGTRVPSASPVRVAALGNDVVELAAGDDRNCARKADESIWCWGSEANGDFVPGMSHDVLTPEQIMFPP